MESKKLKYVATCTSVIQVIVGSGRLLFSVLRRVQLVDPWPIVGRVSSKCYIKVLPKQGKKRKNINAGECYIYSTHAREYPRRICKLEFQNHTEN